MARTKRWQWLAKIVRKHNLMFGAELGVKSGRTCIYLLEQFPRLRMIAVDCWQPQPDNPGPQNYTDGWDHIANEQQFRRQAARFKDRLIIFKGFTHQIAGKIQDSSLDFVFIDADHGYEACKRDILMWRSKIKPGGFLTGHDTHFEGVHRALMELYPSYKDTGVDHVWYVRLP